MKITKSIEAVRWFKVGDHPNVKAAGPLIYQRGEMAYITGMWPMATHWLTLKPLAEKPDMPETHGMFMRGAIQYKSKTPGEPDYFRESLPFAFWKVSGEKIERPIESEEDKLFAEDYAGLMWALTPKDQRKDIVPHGWISPPCKDGRLVVYPGDWVITEPDGGFTVLSDADFCRQYGEQS